MVSGHTFDPKGRQRDSPSILLLFTFDSYLGKIIEHSYSIDEGHQNAMTKLKENESQQSELVCGICQVRIITLGSKEYRYTLEI